MLPKIPRALHRIVALPALIVAIGALAESELPDDEKAALRERVQLRWEALGDRDYESAYDLMSPAYRAVFTEEMYVGQFSSTVERELTSVEILNYDAPAAVASVAVGVMSRPAKLTSAAAAILNAKPVTISEQWIFRNNNWWFSVNR